jgi:shikimate dehydrogenase
MKFALLGHNIDYSLSPLIHKMIGPSDLVYDILDLSESQLEKELKAKARDYAGFNVTIPHKQNIMAFCQEIDPVARKIGAVNTVAIRDGLWKGYNTDYPGFMETLRTDCPDFLSYHPVLVGYGGVARAAIFGLEALGFMACTVIGGEIDSERDAFIHDMRVPLSMKILDEIPDMPLLWINCTPVGGAKIKDIPSDFMSFRRRDILFDLNYTPYPTHLEVAARMQGIKTFNGLKMLVFQAIEAEKIWHHGDNDLMCDTDTIIDIIVKDKYVS